MTIAVQVTKDDGAIDYWTYQLVKEVPPAIAGRWKLANEAGSAGVGPAPGNVDWWSLGAGDLTARACFMDDVYVFGADGSFSLELGDQTWLETWQSDAEACGTPVAPHDGSGTYSYTYVAGETITVNGAGAYIGIAKAGNTYAYESNGVPTSIIYTVESLNAAKTAMTIAVQVTKDDGATDYWTYQLVKGDSAGGTDPVDPVDNDLGTGDNNVLNIGEAIDFNSVLANYGFEDFEGGHTSSLVQDPTDATNTVVQVIKTCGETCQVWAGTTIAKGLVIYPLTDTETVMTVRVWSPAVGVTVRLKLEESGDPTHTVETDAVTTIAEAWETLTFDFSNPATNDGNATNPLNTSYVFDTLSIFLNYGVLGTGETYYYDDVTFVGAATDDPVASAFAGPWGSFGGATADNDTSTYSVATGSEGWAGFANENASLYPFSFANGGTITFTGSVPSGGDVNVNFRFERLPHPDVDPSFNTDVVVVSGATEATYTVTIAAQDAANTFSSFLMYITTLDVDVVIKDVDVSENSAFAGPWGSFGGATADNDTSTYSVATGSEGWAGFANENASLYPFSFANGGTITFTGSVPSGGDVNVNFRFERLPHPDVDPSFNTDVVVVSGATEATYTVTIAAQDAANTFSSFLMYITTLDVDVVIKDVLVTETAS